VPAKIKIKNNSINNQEEEPDNIVSSEELDEFPAKEVANYNNAVDETTALDEEDADITGAAADDLEEEEEDDTYENRDDETDEDASSEDESSPPDERQ